MNQNMTEVPTLGQSTGTIFTIVAGTTIPDRAEIVRSHCREGSAVELRREGDDAEDRSTIGVWLQCRSLFGLMSVRKKIGHVPVETAQALEPLMDESSTIVARATVRTVYAPIDRSEAVVTVEIEPLPRRSDAIV